MKRIWLKEARLRKRLTQTELANRIGRPQSLISRLENGVYTDPTFSDVKALARELDVDPMALRFHERQERVAS